jgi:CRISPR-associated endonuclease/helicase Cas3
MPPLAHSAREKRGIPAQEYSAHIGGVTQRAIEFAGAAARYWSGARELLPELLRLAASVHDLGKLDGENQQVLRTSETKGLPVRHEIAGVKHLLDTGQRAAGVLVASHHRGLPDLLPWVHRNIEDLRDSEADLKAIERATRYLGEYLEEHQRWCARLEPGDSNPAVLAVTGLAWRFALSCLVDADYGDTATHYAQEQPTPPLEPRWAERRRALDHYVAGLQEEGRGNAERNGLRQRIYEACRDVPPHSRVYACDSAVGTGKTTAVMAHLLRVAEERGLRHVFVVLPYTNIISQSVDVYREALSLQGEDPEEVVAAHHHQADYGSAVSRQFATLWDCPITVTTAVQFFETMAGAASPKLRKFHELPGSAIFIDEAHAAIPAKLWPQTWMWLQELTEAWGCHVVLGSGSLVRFWEDPDFVRPPVSIPDLVPADIGAEAKGAERSRVSYRRRTDRLTTEQLSGFVFSKALPGPRLVIVNTVQSAAVIAKGMREAGHMVLHLSTALAPGDRGRAMGRIRDLLASGAERNWALVATSCVEAGVDFSFGSAVRELASACSMIQVGGRVNRHGGGDGAESPVWVVSLDGAGLTANPGMKVPARVLQTLFDAGAVDRLDLGASDLCTKALRRELNEGSADLLEEIKKAEQKLHFPDVAKLYRVIEDDTEPVVVGEILRRLEGGEHLSAADLMKGTVRIREGNFRKFSVRRGIRGFDDLNAWTLDYDAEFLGYMSGVLASAAAAAGEFTGA